VRHAGVAANGKDGSFGVFRAGFGQPQIDPRVRVADSNRAAVLVDQHAVAAGVAAQPPGHAVDHAGGDLAHAADTLDLVGFLGLHGFEDEGFVQVAADLHFGQFVAQQAEHAVSQTGVHHTVQHHAAGGDAGVGQHALIAQSQQPAGVTACLLVQLAVRKNAVGPGFQACARGFVALHAVVIQHRRFAARFDQIAPGDVHHAGHVDHGRVVHSRSGDEDGVDVVFLHETVEIRAHKGFAFLE